MRVSTAIASWALLGVGTMACGSGTSTLSGSATDAGSSDGGDATSLDSASADGTSESDAGAVDGAAAIETDAPGDAPPSGSSGDSGESSDAGDSGTEAGPSLGSMPTPATMALLRVANWSTDAPAIDLCIAPHGTAAFQGPIVAELAASSMSDGGADGIASPLVSAYVGVTPGQYDGRIVVAGASDCGAGIGPDATTLPSVAVGGSATIALFGSVAAAPGEAKMRVFGFLDDLVAPTGATAIRVINAVSGMPQIDVGTGTLSDGKFLAIFRQVPFGMAGQPGGAWIPFLVDANDYDSNPPLANVVLSAHATGASTDAVPLSSPPPLTSIGVGSVITIAVVGGAAGVGTALVECFDNAGTVGTLSDCIVTM
jgi:hypothetical protein